ncbi:hypothetical protein Q3C01_23990 [Bradyrhizobium sp. UFLA05-109]
MLDEHAVDSSFAPPCGSAWKPNTGSTWPERRKTSSLQVSRGDFTLDLSLSHPNVLRFATQGRRGDPITAIKDKVIEDDVKGAAVAHGVTLVGQLQANL